MNTATSGTQVYGTNLDGNHPDGTKGYIISGCYELTSIVSPVLKFDMAFDLEQNFDIVFVEYSIDQGTSWTNLGELGSQPNWYNSDRTNASSGDADDCQNCPGGQWTGTNSTMQTYAYDFLANAINGETDLTQEDNIIFRIVFQSDPSVNQEGAIVDNFVVEGFQDDEDDDNDGILDVDDNCPLIGNSDQADTDGDGIGNVCDQDDDNDGINDTIDNCPLIANPNQEDDDNDGIGNSCDDDSDNDGVPNPVDLCPNTPQGAVVDIDGCEIFSLPSDNFSIQSIGESCQSSNNGIINVNAVATTLDYTATIVIDGVTVETEFNEFTSFENLSSGIYELCITIADQPGYQSCFNLEIKQPEALSVSGKVSSLENKITLSLQGGAVYNINLNGKFYQTRKNEIVLPLETRENTIKVTTDINCQGSYEETIILSDELLIYPNPISEGNLNILLGNVPEGFIEMTLFDITGVKIFNKTINLNNSNRLTFNMDSYANGIYIINVKTKDELVNYKIIKK